MKATVTARVSGSFDDLKVIASETPNFASKIESSVVARNEFGFVRAEIENLDPDTLYYVGVESDTGLRGEFTGKMRTPKTGAHTFSFASASCALTGSSGLVFDAIRARAEAGEISFFIHSGDLHYEDIVVNDPALFHAAYDEVFNAPRQRKLWSVLPMYYMWDDHDFGPDDSGRDSPSRQAAVAAYRSRVPSPPLVKSGAEDAPYYSFVRGRVRFIVTDVRSERAEKGEFPSNDPDQVIFTNDQRDWLFAEMLAAEGADQAIIWVNTKVWVASVSNGADHMGGYAAARQEIADFITDNDLNRRVAILSGDMHALAFDDGSSANNPAGLRVMQAAALERARVNIGGPYSVGPIALPPTGIHSQYGLIDVTDSTGTGDVEVRFRGISVDRATGQETVLIDETFSLGANL